MDWSPSVMMASSSEWVSALSLINEMLSSGAPCWMSGAVKEKVTCSSVISRQMKRCSADKSASLNRWRHALHFSKWLFRYTLRWHLYVKFFEHLSHLYSFFSVLLPLPYFMMHDVWLMIKFYHIKDKYKYHLWKHAFPSWLEVALNTFLHGWQVALANWKHFIDSWGYILSFHSFYFNYLKMITKNYNF